MACLNVLLVGLVEVTWAILALQSNIKYLSEVGKIDDDGFAAEELEVYVSDIW